MGYIKSYFIKDLLDKVDIVDVISDYTDLKKSGSTYFGLSPFTSEKTASFSVHPVKQRYNDFSSGKAGNVITFLMDHKNMSYPEAIETIATKYGIPVQYESEEFAKKKIEREKKRKSLRPVLLSSQKLFVNEFENLPEDHPAKIEIYQKRKYNKDIIIDWGIGFASGGKFIYNKVYEIGLTKEASSLGLINTEKQCDKHWNRVTYPLHDKNGLLNGFATRDLSGKKNVAKWMNPPESDIYQKKKSWFGLHRAAAEINKTDEAWIVEGYNDVIAWHEHGITNTVASSGTAIPYELRMILKSLCKHVTFCFDPDAAGCKALIKYIPLFMMNGFRVNVVRLPGVDPDDFVRLHSKSIENFGLPALMDEKGIKEDGFKILIEEYLKGSEVEITQGAQKLCKTIATIEDEALKEIYTQWLQKESKLTKSTLNKWIKGANEELVKTENEQIRKYILPKEVNISYKEIENDIYNYGLFMANNKIWFASAESDDRKVHFVSHSNFAIEIIQHMQDEKFPMKLIRLKNIYGLEKIFDIPSDNLNKHQRFDDAITNYGNYQFTGGNREFLKLRAYLFDKMGTGRKIDVLGWQPEGFWCFNNKIIVPDQGELKLDDNGIMVFDKIYYYIPSANKIYSNNQFRFDAQKRFQVFEAKQNFHTYTAQMIKVHRAHAITGILFSIASIFQDIIVTQEGSFPILFLYGPGSSGKDQLADCCQSFFGVPQTAINLEGNVSTVKAQVREFAQFSNSMGHLSEYKRGNPTVDGILKGLWDRRGYKRGNLESHVGTESIPILSSTLLTGNDFPDAEPLIMRFLWNEMVKNQFTDEETEEFDKLKDMTNAGVSSYSVEIIKHRPEFQKKFQKAFRGFKETFHNRVPDAKSRMIANVAVLGATYQIFKDILDFAFTFNEMEAHFVDSTEKQVRKLQAASILTRFWDCFVASVRGPKTERLQVKYDFKIEGNSLFFNYTNVYNKIQRQWYVQYREPSPGKNTIKDQLVKDAGYITYHTKGVRMDTGRYSKNTSALEIDLNLIDVKDEIMMASEYQLNEGGLWDKSPETPDPTIFDPPATPKKNEILEN